MLKPYSKAINRVSKSLLIYILRFSFESFAFYEHIDYDHTKLRHFKKVISLIPIELVIVLLIIALSATGFYIASDKILGSSAKNFQTEKTNEQSSSQNSPIPTPTPIEDRIQGLKTSLNNTTTTTPSPTPTSIQLKPTSSPASTPQSTTSNYSTFIYPWPTPTVIQSPAPQGLSKELCDAKRNSLDTDLYYAVIDSKRRYESEVTALAHEYSRRGIPLESGSYQQALSAVEDKYSEELDHIEADYNNKVNLLIAEGCSF